MGIMIHSVRVEQLDIAYSDQGPREAAVVLHVLPKVFSNTAKSNLAQPRVVISQKNIRCGLVAARPVTIVGTHTETRCKQRKSLRV